MQIAYPFHKHHTRLLWILTALWLSVALFALLLFLFGPPYIPLWMSLVEPAEKLAPKVFIWTLPVTATLLYVLTLFFARKSNLEHEEYLATLSLWSGILTEGLLLLAVWRILKVLL